MATGNNKKASKLVVAGIDFGTTYSAYAYCFKHHYESDPLKIFSHVWTDGKGIVSAKVPTTVLFDRNGEFHSFGYEAEEKYAQLSSMDKHIGWKYFRRFKMLLHNKSNLMLKTKIRDDQGQSMEAIKVFSAAIRYLKQDLLSRLNDSHIANRNSDAANVDKTLTQGETESNKDNCIHPDDIFWVLTVPAIWNDSAKQFMRSAAERADIPRDQLLLALEPEAAAIFTKANVLSNKCPENLNTFQKESQFMVIDAGGGTVDITVHKVDKDGNLFELFPPSGGPWGGILVDEKIHKFTEDLFGRNVLNILKQESKTEELDMLRTLELKKREFKVTDDRDARVNITFPSSLYEIYQEENPTLNFAEMLKERYQGVVEKKRGRLIIKNELFHHLYMESILNLTSHLEDLIGKPNMENVKTFVMVGGYSECEVLKAHIKEAFKDKRVVFPEESSVAVVKGAVIYGHRPDVIGSRKAAYTYGISTAVPFDERVHPAKLKVHDMCQGVFKVFIPIGTEIIPGKTQVKHTFNPVKSSLVEIYKSISEEPSFETDPGCERVGEINIDNPNGNRGLIEVTMLFGDTELHVEAKEIESGNKMSAEFKFLK